MDRLNGLAVSESAYDPAEFASVIALPTFLCESCFRPLRPCGPELKIGAKTVEGYCAETHNCPLQGLILELPLMRMRVKRAGQKLSIAVPG